MKLPDPVAWSVTWDKCHCGNFFQRQEYATTHKQRLDAKFPQDAREVVGLFDEAQLREALASNEAVMRMALEALKQMMSIVAIHSRATKNNFAWAEMDEARAAIKALKEQLK